MSKYDSRLHLVCVRSETETWHIFVVYRGSLPILGHELLRSPKAQSCQWWSLPTDHTGGNCDLLVKSVAVNVVGSSSVGILVSLYVFTCVEGGFCHDRTSRFVSF